VGTWNLENLFRPGGDFGSDDEATYRGKLTALAATINAASPDVLGVQEVGQPEALADLVDLLDGDWYAQLSSHFDAGHPIRVGVLAALEAAKRSSPLITKHPIMSARTVRWRFGSGFAKTATSTAAARHACAISRALPELNGTLNLAAPPCETPRRWTCRLATRC
jgi:hypothetical protein